MNRYEVNKVMRWVAHDAAAAERWAADPTEVLRRYRLNGEEQQALRECDYPRLYAAGVHPQLLRRFVAAAWPGDREELRRSYTANVAPYGRPDFST